MSRLSIWQRIKQLLVRTFFVLAILTFFLTIYLDSIVRDEFNQQAWNIPAKVYARPLSFSVGQSIKMEELIEELELLGYRKKIKAINQGEYERYGKTLVINTRGFKFWDGDQPQQVLEVEINNGRVSRLKDFSTQKAVSFLRLDPLSLGSIQTGNDEDRQLVTLSQLPPNFIATLLTTEDREFYDHWGISLKGIARAFWSNISQGEVRQGGSTLTQQLMKNHFLSNERTLWRKFREAIMAILTEYHYDKDLILEAYINEVYLGQNNNTGIYGFARASEFYFDRPLEQLNTSQVALLVGIVKGPSYYNPRRNPEKAKNRRDLVLGLLLEQGLITEEEHKDSIARNLMVVAKPRTRTSLVPSFMGFIKRELQSEYSLSRLNREGLKLFTSIDPIIQRKAEKALSDRLNRIEGMGTKPSPKDPSLQGAVIVSDIQSGDIVAMVGDRNADFVGFNRAIDAYRQTGSVIKPFVYLTALQEQTFNMLSPIEDEPFTLEGDDGSLWTPKNYDNQSHGIVELREGMINSYNLATARLAMLVGVKSVADTIVESGFERKLSAYPSLALGAKEMSPLEVLRLYQVLANDGVGIRSSGLIAVQDHQGNLLQRYVRATEPRLDSDAVFLTKYLLTQVTARGTAKSIGNAFPDKVFGGKTGTTNDLRDSWYAGFGGKNLGVVWVGRDDNQPTQLTGASGALMVWRDLFSSIDEPSVTMELPEGVVWAYKDESFFSRFSACENKDLIPFYRDYLPQEYKICD